MAPKLETKSIIGVVAALIVGLALSPLLISFVSSAQPYSYTTYQLLNYDFSDNTIGTIPDNWENQTEPDPSSYTTNDWNASGYVTVTRTDNDDSYENGIWFQRLSLLSMHDEIYTATINFKYRVIDNENAGSIVVRVLMDSGDGTENFVVFYENVTAGESASWTSVENNIIENIIAVGTYALWLGADMNPAHSNVDEVGTDGSSCIVGWDDAYLTIVGRTRTYTSMMILAYLIPLFFVIGLVLMVVYWATSRSR